jgi:hypothetical protein
VLGISQVQNVSNLQFWSTFFALFEIQKPYLSVLLWRLLGSAIFLYIFYIEYAILAFLCSMPDEINWPKKIQKWKPINKCGSALLTIKFASKGNPTN